MAQTTIAALVCTTALAIPIVKLYQLNQSIKDCWPSIKCTPIGLLIQPIFGPSNVSMIENAENCAASSFSSMFGTNISETNSNVSALTGITSSLATSINDIRSTISTMQQSLYTSLESIAIQILNAYSRIGNLVTIIVTIIKKVGDVFYKIILLLQVIFYTVGSVWNGPIGGAARYFGGML
jgi:hypothetical protein